jgi:hypothetical protein
MAGLPKCSDAMTSLRATAGDACFLGTNRARMFTPPGQFWKAAVVPRIMLSCQCPRKTFVHVPSTPRLLNVQTTGLPGLSFVNPG